MSLTLAAEGPTSPFPAPGQLLAKLLGQLAPTDRAFLAEAWGVRKLATGGDPLGGRDACYGACRTAGNRWPRGCAFLAADEHVHSFVIARQVFKEPFRAYLRPRRSRLRLVAVGLCPAGSAVRLRPSCVGRWLGHCWPPQIRRLVELRGFEPLTLGLQSRCSPS